MIQLFRDTVVHHLEGSPWPVHRTLPDDVAEVPCIAVPRPRLLPDSTTNTLITGLCIVLVVGNRINNADAQNELDDVTDLVIDRFGGLAKSIRLEDPVIKRLVLQEVNPTTVLVAGNEYHAYALSIEATMATC